MLPAFTPSRNGSCSFQTFAEICPLALPSWSTANGSPFLVTLSSRPRTMSSCCTRAPTASDPMSSTLIAGPPVRSRLGHPDDFAFVVDAHLDLKSADAARLPGDPRLVQLGALSLRRRLHRQLLERVLAALLALVRARDFFRAFARDLP